MGVRPPSVMPSTSPPRALNPCPYRPPDINNSPFFLGPESSSPHLANDAMADPEWRLPDTCPGPALGAPVSAPPSAAGIPSTGYGPPPGLGPGLAPVPCPRGGGYLAPSSARNPAPHAAPAPPESTAVRASAGHCAPRQAMANGTRVGMALCGSPPVAGALETPLSPVAPHRFGAAPGWEAQGYEARPLPAATLASPASSAARSRRAPRKHTTKEEASFQCSVQGCGKFFSRSYNFRSHMETHDEQHEYPFPCLVGGCSKKFVRKTDLQRHHQSVHAKERNHRCDFCGRLFARKDTLRRHMEDGCARRFDIKTLDLRPDSRCSASPADRSPRSGLGPDHPLGAPSVQAPGRTWERPAGDLA